MSAGAIDLTEYNEKLGHYRQRVGDWLATARESFLRAMHSDSNILTWYGEKFWVDRVRWLVVPLLAFDTPPGGFTLVEGRADGEISENLEVYGGPSRMHASYQFLSGLGAMLSGEAMKHPWVVTAAHLLNLAIVQPLINPPFGPLFWLAFAEDAPGPADNLYADIAPMMFDMSVYPTREPSPEAVRRAQGEFLLRFTSGLVGEDAEQRSADSWLRVCSWQLWAQWPMMDRLFTAIWSSTTQAEIAARKSRG
jgi:hypothetical protein